eukprot:scaffold7112_cov155-Amphora_coffeaeformis.AAC.1
MGHVEGAKTTNRNQQDSPFGPTPTPITARTQGVGTHTLVRWRTNDAASLFLMAMVTFRARSWGFLDKYGIENFKPRIESCAHTTLYAQS